LTVCIHARAVAQYDVTPSITRIADPGRHSRPTDSCKWSSVLNAQDASLEALDRRAQPGRPKSDSKRRAIVEAAKQLFLAQGYEHTSLENIAAAANVSKPTLYGHFRDKDDLHLQA
jgi:methylphosphotriester-DNA--protein-cysteine methyltransferase